MTCWIWSTDSWVERATSVSSMRRMNVPSTWRACNQLYSAVRTLPMWRKPVGAGEKAVVNDSGVVSISTSWQNQLDHGKTVDQLHGGYLGIDLNGDGVADADTYADPHGEIPEQAQSRGAACHGVVSIEAEISCNS